MRFVDTNVFLRLLTNDDAAKAEQARLFFKNLESGQGEACTNSAVLAEIVYVLTSPAIYGLSREDVANRFRLILQLKGLQIPNRKMHQHAIDVFESTRLDFADCLIAADMKRQGITEIVSYDRDFDRIADISRVER